MTDGLKRGDGEEAGLRKKLGPFYEVALFACTYTIDYCNVRKRTLGERIESRCLRDHQLSRWTL